MTLVVDASVAIKWIVPEADEEVAQALFLRESDLIAPDFLMIEVGNVLRSKLARKELDRIQIEAGYEFTRSAIDRFVPDRDLISRAFKLAAEIGHGVYDCMYLSCAESEKAQVITADEKFLGKLRRSRYASLACHLVS